MMGLRWWRAKQVRHAEHYCVACAKWAMRPVIARPGCPYCGRDMLPMWAEALAWETWKVYNRNRDLFEQLESTHAAILGDTLLPDLNDPMWVCPECDETDSNMRSDVVLSCPRCGAWMRPHNY